MNRIGPIALAWLAGAVLAGAPVRAAGEDLPPALVSAVRAEAEGPDSTALAIALELSDAIGPRLTASPGANAALAALKQRYERWGLSDVRLETFPFGSSWESTAVSLTMTAPRAHALRAAPVAWSVASAGRVEGPVVVVDGADEAGWRRHAGALKGRIVLLAGDVARPGALAGDEGRLSDKALAERATFDAEPYDLEAARRARAERGERQQAFFRFLKEQGVLALLRASPYPRGVLTAEVTEYRPERVAPVPQAIVAAEDVNLVRRLLDKGAPVRLALELKARSDAGDGLGRNLIADIPGRTRGDEVVMIGAHLDSWHVGPGARDNAAGVAIVSEAARILAAMPRKPARTIRIALWTGEEQLMIGSSEYIGAHLASRPLSPDPVQRAQPPAVRLDTWPLRKRAGYEKLVAYFNVDDGGGRIRGVEIEQNFAAGEILKDWLAPFHPDAATIAPTRTYGSDHVVFTLAGLPAFNFIQDEAPGAHLFHYHTDLDTADLIDEAALRQAAAVVAAFAYQAADRRDALPRPAFPKAPARSKD